VQFPVCSCCKLVAYTRHSLWWKSTRRYMPTYFRIRFWDSQLLVLAS
jgi:hypothetical protein